MAAKDGKHTPNPKGGPLVKELAQAAISRADVGSSRSTGVKLEAGTEFLVSSVLGLSRFDITAVRSELDAMQINQSELLDHCIPDAARALGTGWLADQLSFAKVSTASARLFGMCKAYGNEWSETERGSDRAILLVTIDREDHLVGPTIVADQLRRRGISVQTLYGATPQAILHRMRGGCFEAVWISSASHRSLDLTEKAIKTLKDEGIEQPVVLGGAILDLEDGLDGGTGADLVTKDLDKALSAVATSLVAT